MKSHPFRIVNVFTHNGGALTGNPLCVFEDGAGLDTAVMQALARQFNLSETTFILPSSRAEARVRIFTPNYEMPFAGHPTLGTAHVCRALKLGGDSLRLEMQVGLIDVLAQGDRWTLTAQPPTWRELDVPRSVLANALGITERDIGERPLWVKAGKEQLVVPLNSEEAVRRVAPGRSRCRASAARTA
jgi:PhzF family phenazine biosynthesis protein